MFFFGRCSPYEAGLSSQIDLLQYVGPYSCFRSNEDGYLEAPSNGFLPDLAVELAFLAEKSVQYTNISGTICFHGLAITNGRIR